MTALPDNGTISQAAAAVIRWRNSELRAAGDATAALHVLSAVLVGDLPLPRMTYEIKQLLELWRPARQTEELTEEEPDRADRGDCPDCDGNGQIRGLNCPTCHATGEAPTEGETARREPHRGILGDLD